tara:strand:+ start:123 stop:479 length:357 start_codon:yes stop_codon:yes gene_type:complete
MYCQDVLSSYDKIITLFAANGFKYELIENNSCTLTQNYNELNVFAISIKPMCKKGVPVYCWEIKIPLGEKNITYVTYFDLDRINDIKKYLLYHVKRWLLKTSNIVLGIDRLDQSYFIK